MSNTCNTYKFIYFYLFIFIYLFLFIYFYLFLFYKPRFQLVSFNHDKK